ncbi:MAG: leucyl aminopeptidase [Duodenibacillus sp.]
MQFSVSTQSIETLDSPTLVVAVFVGNKGCVELTAAAKALDAAAQGAISDVLADETFAGKAGETLVLHRLTGVASRRVVLLGFGDKKTLDAARFVKTLSGWAAGNRAQDVALAVAEAVPESLDEVWAARTAARVVTFASSRPTLLKTTREKKAELASCAWLAAVENSDVAAALETGRVCGQAMLWAKTLQELPPNICTPQYVAKAARDLKESRSAVKGLSVEVLDRKAIEKRGMGGVLAVASGAKGDPVFIELSWQGARAKDAPVVFVGKGITFDAGGISLKPARNMDGMKFDMSGAAAAMALVKAASDLALKLNVTALVPCCENLPSGSATRPGDVITTASGKTVEVLNTDAEGRLILADALTRAAELDPAVCIDIATLTGACITALGTSMSGLFCDDPDLTAQLREAGARAADALWPMPMGGEYRTMLESAAADLANIGSAPNAGACVAATFLAEFAPKCPWAHLDVAGTANSMGFKKEGFARPVPVLLEWLLARTSAAKKAKAKKHK